MPKTNDPSDDIYHMLDRAGLDAATIFDTKRSMVAVINGIRTKIVTDLKEYIEMRERRLKEDIIRERSL